MKRIGAMMGVERPVRPPVEDEDALVEKVADALHRGGRAAVTESVALAVECAEQSQGAQRVRYLRRALNLLEGRT